MRACCCRYQRDGDAKVHRQGLEIWVPGDSKWSLCIGTQSSAHSICRTPHCMKALSFSLSSCMHIYVVCPSYIMTSSSMVTINSLATLANIFVIVALHEHTCCQHPHATTEHSAHATALSNLILRYAACSRSMRVQSSPSHPSPAPSHATVSI